jgi:hypothetical protein
VFKPNCYILTVRIPGRQVPKPKCLGPAADSLSVRIPGRQVPKPKCLSPAVDCLSIPGRLDYSSVPKYFPRTPNTISFMSFVIHQTKKERQCMDSYFSCIIIFLDSRIIGCQPMYLGLGT